MKSPNIDLRDKNLILEHIKQIAPFYVPEWKVSEEDPDVGWVLANVFAQIFADTIKRFNQVPYKDYVDFLNLLSVKLLPSTPAKGYVSVRLNHGTEPGVFIKKGSKLYVDKGEEVGRVIFETQDDLWAIDNEVTDIYCVNSISDKIVKPFTREQSQEAYKIFDFNNYPNLQENILFLAQKNVLNIKNRAQIEIEIINLLRKSQETSMAEYLGNPANAEWFILTGNGWKQTEVADTLGNKVVLKTDEKVTLEYLTEIENRWIKCQLKENDKPFSISVTDLRIAAKGEKIEPEILVNNDLQLAAHAFLPFGEKFSIYDDFYIGSEEVFTKKGALITLRFDLYHKEFPIETAFEDEVDWKLIMNENELNKRKAYRITIQEVVWEYWNGNGWARLFLAEEHEQIFRQEDKHHFKINFICPQDLDVAYVGAHYNYWIRARIKKVNNAYKVAGFYLSPLIEQLTLDYNYRAETQPLDNVKLQSSLVTKNIDFQQNREIAVFNNKRAAEIAAYFALNNPIIGGPVTIYFKIDENEQKILPHLRWEYYGKLNGRSKWLELKMSDETKMLHHSGLLTFVINNSFVKTSIFGQEKYWIRAVDKEQKYHNSSDWNKLPNIRGIYFNTVKIVQQETFAMEYFYIEPEQQNKTCDLIANNLVWQEVWVDEYKHLNNQELGELKEFHTVEIEKDDEGNIKSFWVKWQQVEEMILAGPNERCYVVDEYNGKIIFGNGFNGKIPSSGTSETIKVKYSVGKGREGNVYPEEINAFAESVPFINSVFNVDSILGGCSRETIDSALKRGPALIKSQNRMVTSDDFIDLVKQADRNIVKVKCQAHYNPKGEKEPGALTIAVLPLNYHNTYNYFAGIKQNVLSQFKKNSASVVSYSDKLYLIEVMYLEICTKLEIIIEDYNYYQQVLQDVERNLQTFLDPIKGNYDGNGWEIGEYPNREKIYNFIKIVNNITAINSINILTYLITPNGKREIDYEEIEKFPFIIPICGQHEVNIVVQEF